MKRRLGRKPDEETTYWLSYSDMMAGLLLTFVLIISLTVLRSKIQYDEKQNELAGKEQELIIQSAELENERLTIDEQGAKLNAQELKLSEQEGRLLTQQQELEKQQNLLREQSELLADLQDLLDDQQAKLDNIIGIKAELIEALSKEFNDSALNVAVNENTGAISMDSSILFEYNKDDLKGTGKGFLEDFMPRYLKILLSDEYNPFVSEIVIEGHTDTTGNYFFNLDLSQKRAYSVAEYCMNEKNHVLNKEESEKLKAVLSTVGKSYSNPIYKEDGTVDAEASRRVEIQFRLRDEEMIREMIEILNETKKEEKKKESAKKRSSKK